MNALLAAAIMNKDIRLCCKRTRIKKTKVFQKVMLDIA